jgi:hypothetical protein
MRALIWRFYRNLKAYRRNPTPARKAALQTRFDRIFTSRTGFVTLDRLLARLHANKSELLKVLDRPEIPLHTNGSENDIRCQVIRRKVSGEPAAMPAATAATPSSGSPSPAQSSASPSGIISAHASSFPAAPQFRSFPKSSASAPLSHPDCQDSCPSCLRSS